MIVVIQCAARKSPDAGHLRRADGKQVLFVADPDSAPADKAYFYSRPDDQSDNAGSSGEFRGQGVPGTRSSGDTIGVNPLGETINQGQVASGAIGVPGVPGTQYLILRIV